MKMQSNTKIVATLGPASYEEDVVQDMILAGMDVARLNFSHGAYQDHEAIYWRLRTIAGHLGRSITIMQDLQGPKIRTGELVDDQINLRANQSLTLTTRSVQGDERIVSVDFVGLTKCTQPGNRILLDDGNLELQVTDVSEDEVETCVIVGGTLKSHKGVNLPGAELDIPGLTSKDERDLAFGLKLGIDAVAVSFVRTVDDIKRVRQAIERFAPEQKNTPIIAKLERPEALDNLEDIVEAADGVMVARGDLGVELPPELVPIAQKRIIEAANRRSRIVITATQMLDSMIQNPRPTRAESSDVANAIFDGTDAVMLSGETAVGKYPVKSVKMMDRIIRQAEEHISEFGRWHGTIQHKQFHDDTYFTTQAACELAHDRMVAALAVFTQSGRTARLLSKSRPEVPILAFTSNPYTYQRMNMYWGVKPHLVPYVDKIKVMIQAVEDAMLASSPIEPGQQVVLICGFPLHAVRPTNMALLHTVGDKY
jgi:pyruvate kinase